MFIRSIKVRSSAGNVHEYVRVVSSVRENGKVKQKVVANLGRRDTLEAVLPLLNRFLLGEDNEQQLAKELAQDGTLEVVEAGTWGPMLVARHLFQQLGLFPLLDAGRRWPKLLPEEDPDDDWPSRVLAMLTNRLTGPESEHGLAGWLENHYIMDRIGRRYVPCGSSLRAVLERAGTRQSRHGPTPALVPHTGSSCVEQNRNRSGVVPPVARFV